MMNANQALQALKQGNQRFVDAVARNDTIVKKPVTTAAEQGQQPFAIILGCSDSRVPAEMVFDQGLGDLFVIRIAGNIVQPSQIGSVEFAAAQFGTRLVVVMGHTHCGAVNATLQQLNTPVESQSPNLKVIVDKISPAVKPLVEANPHADCASLMGEAIKANVQASVANLKQGSDILKDLVANEGLVIVGAEYDIESGEVVFFE